MHRTKLPWRVPRPDPTRSHEGEAFWKTIACHLTDLAAPKSDGHRVHKPTVLARRGCTSLRGKWMYLDTIRAFLKYLCGCERRIIGRLRSVLILRTDFVFELGFLSREFSLVLHEVRNCIST
jgi:hypothetical protein